MPTVETTRDVTEPESAGAGTTEACRLCGSVVLRSFVDLGATPPCELFLAAEALERPEVTYPLHVRVCEGCLLAQLPPLITPEETFTEYAYFSSFSTSWVEHARRFVDAALPRLKPDPFVVEVASNDGYLLQHVVERGVRCLGIEPPWVGSSSMSITVRSAAASTRCAVSRLRYEKCSW